MSELETKKKLLAAESDVYRELLRHEVNNLRLYSGKAKKRLTSAGMLSPLLMSLAPWLTGRRGFGVRELGTLAFLGWRWYRHFKSGSEEPEREDAVEEFLRRKL